MTPGNFAPIDPSADHRSSPDSMASPPLSLVLDLSSSLYMGLVDAQGRVAASRIRENARGETAHGILDALLAEAGAVPADIGAIAVGIGPGSFTGIRVAVAMAQGLAFAARTPLHPFSSLAALRACAPGDGGGKDPSRPAADAAVAAIAANAGRYYVSFGRPAAERLMTAEELAALGKGGAGLITSGPFPDRERLAGFFASADRMEERADFPGILALARERPPVADGAIRPNYLMASAAEEKRLAAGGEAGGGPPGGAGA